MTTMPAKNGMPSQTRLTKKSNGTRLARAASRSTAYTASSTTTELVKPAASTVTRNMPSLARGSMPCSQPSPRACSSVKTARSMDSAMPPMDDSSQPMRPSWARAGASGHGAAGSAEAVVPRRARKVPMPTASTPHSRMPMTPESS